MSIEEIITKTVDKAVDKAVKAAVAAEFAKIRKELTAKTETPATAPKEEFLQIKDTLKALHTTRPNLQKLIDAGQIKTCTPPNGKMQIVASSLYEYMRGA